MAAIHQKKARGGTLGTQHFFRSRGVRPKPRIDSAAKAKQSIFNRLKTGVAHSQEPELIFAILDSICGVLHVSTSIAYLSKRLADIGRYDLLEGAQRGEFSYMAAAEWAGLITRRPPTGG